MAKETYPKGTSVSKSKGLMTPSGVKPFVHVDKHDEFYKSYRNWKKKNPRVSHVYEFNGRLLHGNEIMRMIEKNMLHASPPTRTPRNNAGASTSGSTKKRKRTSPRTSSTNSGPTRRVTRSMTRSQSTPSTSTSTTTTRRTTRPKKRVHRRKQSTPQRSHFN